jgi:hypothetical protein
MKVQALNLHPVGLLAQTVPLNALPESPLSPLALLTRCERHSQFWDATP